MPEYTTAQKQQLVEFLQTHADEQFTVSELCAAMGDGTAKPGKSTVYRQIARLCAEGIVRRDERAGSSSFVYQYAVPREACRGAAHFHLRCVHCGRFIHLECAHLAEVRAHIEAEHDFRLGSAQGILWGECGACRKQAEKGK